MAEILSIEGKETASIYAPTTQVYKATHDRDGNRLPYRYRSFISFSFGDKLIEDFGFIAITDGDRLNRDIYSKFDDIIENHETLDGQIYWGTHLTNNELNLTLATDGVTAKQLDDFKQWFAPGKIRELILMEHPNRAIMARVSNVPQFSMLPFSSNTNVKILGQEYATEVTLFKGEISLSFIMDEPYWYSKNNIIYNFMPKGGANGILNINDDPYVLKDLLEKEYKDSEKRIYVEFIESNITYYKPVYVLGMEIVEKGYWELSCKFEDGTKKVLSYPSRRSNEGKPRIISLYSAALTTLSVEDTISYGKVDIDSAKDYTKIILEDNIPHLQMIQGNILLGENIGATNDAESKVYNNTNNTINNLEPWTGAHVTFYGYVAYDAVGSWAENLEIHESNPQYLFYSGTAPSKPTLQFTFSPTFSNDGYINSPRNQYSHPGEIKNRNYNFISFNDHKFYFTTPSLITGYNQAINIVKNYKTGQSFEDLITILKEKINEYCARAWSIACVKSLRGTEKDENNKDIDKINVDENFKTNFIKGMKYLFCSDGENPNPITCFFDSKHGTATVTYSYIRKANAELIFDFNRKTVSGCFIESEEQNAGDMVKSDYLIIEGRCYPSFNGYISKEECHIIKTDFTATHPLTNVVLTFQNMYY